MQDDLRKLKKRSGQTSDSDSDSEGRRRRTKRSYLEEELARYSKGRGRAAMKAGNKRNKRDEDDDLLKEMGKFSQRVAMAGDEEPEAVEAEEPSALAGLLAEEVGEVDDDVGWLRHKLKFEVDEKELTRRAEEEYAVSHILVSDASDLVR